MYFFADERCVGLNHSDSNYKLCSELLLNHVSITKHQIYTIDPTLIQSPKEAALAYQQQLTRVFQESIPQFDMIFLGMGPDGHTCSLFPNHPLLNESHDWIAPIMDSPKPPSCRITMTFPLLNAARYTIFVATGAGKSGKIHEIFDLGMDYPCSRVKSQQVIWIIDHAAAQELTHSTEDHL